MNKRALQALNVRSVRLLIASVVLMAALAAPVHAVVPPIPQSFYGTVQINGQPAPAGTVVEGRGKSVLTGIVGNPLTTTVAGQYGGPTASDDKLIIQGDPLGNLANGTPIEFYVNGVRATCATPGGAWQASFPFQSSAVTELNLNALTNQLYLPMIRK